MKTHFAPILALGVSVATAAMVNTSNIVSVAPVPRVDAPPNIVDQFSMGLDFSFTDKITEGMLRFVRDKANSTVVGFLFDNDEDEDNIEDSREKEEAKIAADGGNPHQRYFYRQISENTECGDGPCELVQSIAQTSVIGLNGEVNIAVAGSIGFNLNKETQSSTVPNCQSMNPGDVLCVWQRKAYTTYKTDNFDENGERILLTLPNNSNYGGGYVCGRNDRCNFKGYEFWSAATPEGPAMKYPFREAWK